MQYLLTPTQQCRLLRWTAAAETTCSSEPARCSGQQLQTCKTLAGSAHTIGGNTIFVTTARVMLRVVAPNVVSPRISMHCFGVFAAIAAGLSTTPAQLAPASSQASKQSWIVVNVLTSAGCDW